MQESKKKNLTANQNIAIGMFLGVAIFVTLGIATGNLALWMSLGGLSFIPAVSASQSKKKNDEDNPE